MRELVFVAVSVAALAFAAAASAQSPIVIKFSHVVAPDTPKGKGRKVQGACRDLYQRPG